MNRRAVVLVLVGVALGLTGWWVTRNFGFTTEREYVGYRGEAREDRYYAARLFLEGMGKTVSRHATLHTVDALPPDATVLLPGSRANVDPPLARALLAWVERGGRLIVCVCGPSGKDPLLDPLGIEAQWPDDEDENENEDQNKDEPAFELVILGDGTPLRADLHDSYVLQYDGPAAWRHTGPDGDRILVLQQGRGRLVVFSTLRPFSNGGLDQLDHAPLLWHFVQQAGPQIVVVRQLERLSLPAWLAEQARPVLVALAVLVLFWLWRVIPRFGPLQPGDAPQRRSLLEQLRAVGRYHADQRRLPQLLQQVRDDAQALFSRAAPLAAGMDASARLREASRLTRLRPRELMQAFAGTVTTRHEFSNAVRTLAAFRRRLVRSAPRTADR